MNERGRLNVCAECLDMTVPLRTLPANFLEALLLRAECSPDQRRESIAQHKLHAYMGRFEPARPRRCTVPAIRIWFWTLEMPCFERADPGSGLGGSGTLR